MSTGFGGLHINYILLRLFFQGHSCGYIKFTIALVRSASTGCLGNQPLQKRGTEDRPATARAEPPPYNRY